MKKTISLVSALLLLLTVLPMPAALAMDFDYTGDWVCLYVDLGDGVLLSEYDGQILKDVMQVQLNADGTFLLDSFGMQQSGVWQITGAGIAIIADGTVVPFSYEDDMLVNTEDGVTMYFGRAEATPQQGGFSTLLNIGKQNGEPTVDFTGTWNCISYEASGVSYDIELFFPDGIIMTLNPDGTGSVQITAEYAESLTWEAAEDELTISGSYLLFDPIWDPDTKTLSLSYASDIVRVVFEKMEDTAVAPTPLPAATLPQVYTCPFFSISFPEDWEQDEYNTYDWNDFYSVEYSLKDDDGWDISSVIMSVGIEEVGDYRSGINELLEYAADEGNDSLTEIAIGGVNFLGTTYGDYWVYTEYLARVPEASATIQITISDPENIEDVLQEILASVSFTYPVPDPPFVDPPLPEDGVPYQPEPSAINVGGYDLQAVWLPTDESIVVDDQYNLSMAAIDNTVYILNGKMLYTFGLADAALSPINDPVDLGDDYKLLTSTWDGTLYITDGFYTAIAYQDGVMDTFDLDGYLSMNPEGVWGLSYWSSYNVTKVTFTPDGMAHKDWVLTDLSDDAARKGRFSSVNSITITPDHIFVSGSDSTTAYAVRIAMYDFEGNELAVFGSEDWTDDSALGSVAGIVQTNNGILVQDSYAEDYKLFALDGTFLGLVECDDLLGTKNAWPISFIATDNGALALLAQKRDDGSAIELLVFELTGF